MMRLCVFGVAVSAMAVLGTAATPSVTFHKDVQPILQNHCQACHRPGEVAPMSLLTYEQARPWAKSIRQAVLTKKMPPWFADPHYGKFSNDRSLTQADIDTLVAWVDAGAPEGNPQDAPAPRKWVEGWDAGKPDLIVEAPVPFNVPANGSTSSQLVGDRSNQSKRRQVGGFRRSQARRSLGNSSYRGFYSRGLAITWMADKKLGEYFAGDPRYRAGRQARWQPRNHGRVLCPVRAGLDCPAGQSSCCDSSESRLGYRFSDSLYA